MAGGAVSQGGGLSSRSRLSQGVVQESDAACVVEGCVAGGAVSQGGSLFSRSRLLQGIEQLSNVPWVVEGCVAGGAVSQGGGLLSRGRLMHGTEQTPDVGQSVEGCVAGGAVSQGGSLLLSSCLPQGIEQAGCVRRVVDGGMANCPFRGTGVGCVGVLRVPVSDQGGCLGWVAVCGGVLADAGCVAEQAAVFGGAGGAGRSVGAAWRAAAYGRRQVGSRCAGRGGRAGPGSRPAGKPAAGRGGAGVGRGSMRASPSFLAISILMS